MSIGVHTLDAHKAPTRPMPIAHTPDAHTPDAHKRPTRPMHTRPMPIPLTPTRALTTFQPPPPPPQRVLGMGWGGWARRNVVTPLVGVTPPSVGVRFQWKQYRTSQE